MFAKFVKFWIENTKLTFVLILLILWAGVFSWMIIPKQYNPDIVVPAFQITVPAPWFSSIEIEELIVKPLENKITEIEWVEHIYWYANRNFASVMVTFFVWVDKEEATTRLYNKIFSSMNLKPLGAKEPMIQAIDPDEIPVFSYAIINKWNVESGNKNNEILKLRKIGLDVLDRIKLVKWTSVLYLVGGEKDNINIKLDLGKLEAKNIDIMQVYESLQKNNISFPGGDFKVNNLLWQISVEWSLNSIEKVKKLVVTYYKDSPVYIEDVATVYKWISKDEYSTYFASSSGFYDAIYIGIAKQKWTNAVTVMKNLNKKINEIRLDLPNNYEIIEIQNEWKTAEITTNMLLINLIQSIIIIIIILSIFMGRKNALNTAISIPLTLSVIFLFALIIWDNINRITLFALILVLWMLVDDATVVVENVNRHLSMRYKTWKLKLDAILDAIKEVELWVILSTITRLLAFFAMFFVTGMMWEYMWPIPKYAIIAMVTSTIIALSINPFLAYHLAKPPRAEWNIIKKKKYIFTTFLDKINNIKKIISVFFASLKIKDRYMSYMQKYLGKENKQKRSRFKRIFWLIFFAIVFLPPYFYIFKWRMLPKSDQAQIYLRVDTSASTSLDGTREISLKIQDFMKDYIYNPNWLNDDSKIIKNISYRIGIAPVLDFSNTFRGVANRVGENYISMRINLIPQWDRNIVSEDFVIKLRPLLKDFLYNIDPNLKIRILEDPPGPPVRATFMLEVTADPSVEYEDIQTLAKLLQSEFYPILEKDQVVDIENTIEQYKTNYQIVLNHELISRLGLTAEQVAMSLYTMFQWTEISLYHNWKNKEAVNIFLAVKDEQKYDMNSFSYISFTSKNWKKVPLTEIAEIIPTQADLVRYSDDRMSTVYIYGEMWDNSVVYPMIKILRSFGDDGFLNWKYKITKKWLYGVEIVDKITNKKFKINLGGEWELTLDTFRDMWIAMIIAFIGIFFMMVAQFKSFKLGGVIMVSFLLGFFGVFPWYTILYLLNWEYFSSTSMIWVIALAGIVVWNAIILVEYINILIKRWITTKMAIIDAGWTRMPPILITSLTTILWATTILWDPVWWWVAWSIILWLTTSSVMIILVLPIFIYDALEEK